MNDCFDLQEIDDDNVKLRIIAQILGGEVRKRFKGLNTNIIHDIPDFHQTFISRCEFKKNPLQILS